MVADSSFVAVEIFDFVIDRMNDHVVDNVAGAAAVAAVVVVVPFEDWEHNYVRDYSTMAVERVDLPLQNG